MTAFVEMLGKRAMLNKFFLNTCCCLRAFLVTNEERNIYVEVLPHCNNIVLCEIDFTTLKDGIVLYFKFQACKYRVVYIQRCTDQYSTDYLFLELFLVILFPAQNAWKMHRIHGKYDLMFSNHFSRITISLRSFAR